MLPKLICQFDLKKNLVVEDDITYPNDYYTLNASKRIISS